LAFEEYLWANPLIKVESTFMGMRNSFDILGRLYKFAALAYLIIFWIWILGYYLIYDIRGGAELIVWSMILFVVFFVVGTFWYWLIGSAVILIYHKLYLLGRSK
jgi:hypothetical protein